MKLVGFRHSTIKRMELYKEQYEKGTLSNKNKEHYRSLIKMYNKRLLSAINRGGKKVFGKEYICLKLNKRYFDSIIP